MTSNNMSEYGNFVSLKFLSDTYTADEITDFIGVSCNESWKRGDIRKNRKVEEKTNGCIIASRLGKDADLRLQIQDILDRVAGHEIEIERLSAKCEILFSCAVYANEVPPLYFDQEIIKSIARLGAAFDIDLYII